MFNQPLEKDGAYKIIVLTKKLKKMKTKFEKFGTLVPRIFLHPKK
jgi:hypothetical protein